MRFMITKIRRTGAGLVALVAIGCVQNRHAQVEKTPIASEQGGWLRKFPYLTSNTSRHSVFDDPSQWPAKPPESVVQSRFVQMFPNLSRRTSNRPFDGRSAIAAVAADTAQDAVTASSETESVTSEAASSTSDSVAESQVRTASGDAATIVEIDSAVRPLSKSEWANLSASSAGVAAVVAALAATSDDETTSGASAAIPSSDSADPSQSQGESQSLDHVRIAARPMPERGEQSPPVIEAVQPDVATAADRTDNPVTQTADTASAATSQPAPVEAAASPRAETPLAQAPQRDMSSQPTARESSESVSASAIPATESGSATQVTQAPEIPSIPAAVTAAPAIPATDQPEPVSEPAPEIPAIPAAAAPAATANSPTDTPSSPKTVASVPAIPEPAKPAPEIPAIPPAEATSKATSQPTPAPEIPAIPASVAAAPANAAPAIPNPVPVQAEPAVAAPTNPPTATTGTTSPLATATPTPDPVVPAIPAPEVATPVKPAKSMTERPVSSDPGVATVPVSPPAAEATAEKRSAEPVPASSNPPLAPMESPPALAVEPGTPQENLTIPAVPETRVTTPNEPSPVVPALAQGVGLRTGEMTGRQTSPEIAPAPPAPAELPSTLNDPPLPPPAPELKIPGISEVSPGSELPANPTSTSLPTDSGIEKSSGAVQAAADSPQPGMSEAPVEPENAVPAATPVTDAPKLEQAPESIPANDAEIPVLHPLPDDESASDNDSDDSIVQRKPGEIVIQLRLKNPLRLSRFRSSPEETSFTEKATRNLKSAAKNLFAWQRRGQTDSEPAGEPTANVEGNELDRTVMVQSEPAEVVPVSSNESVAASETSQSPEPGKAEQASHPAEVIQGANVPANDAQANVADASRTPQSEAEPAASPSAGAAYYVPARAAGDAPKVRLSNGLPPVEFPSSYHAARPRSANPWHAHAKPAVNLVSDPRNGIAPAPSSEKPAPAAAESVPVTRRDAWPKMKPDLEIVRTSLNVATPNVVPARTSEPVRPPVSQAGQANPSGPGWWSKSGKGLRSFFFGEEEVVPAKRPNWAKQPSTLR